jgi:hypothetical protein
VQPRALGVRNIGDLANRIEGAGIDMPRLSNGDRRSLEIFDSARECIGAHPPLVVDRHADHALGAKTQIAQRRKHRRVRLLAENDMHGRRAEKTVALDIPADAPQHLPPRRGKASEVRHRAAGDKPNRTLTRQIEKFEQPSRGGLLAGASCGRRERIGGILRPGACQPIRR